MAAARDRAATQNAPPALLAQVSDETAPLSARRAAATSLLAQLSASAFSLSDADGARLLVAALDPASPPDLVAPLVQALNCTPTAHVASAVLDADKSKLAALLHRVPALGLAFVASVIGAENPTENADSAALLSVVDLFADAASDALIPSDEGFTDVDVRLAATNAIITACVSHQIAFKLVSHPSLLARILQTAADSFPQLRSSCPIVLSRIIQPIISQKNQPHAKQTKKLLGDQIMAFLESTTSAHKTTGLLALSAIFAASVDYAAGILLADGVMQEIMDLIEFEKEPVQIATISMLGAACADQACRKVIASPECSSQIVKIYKSAKSSDALKNAAAATLVKIVFVDKELEKSVFADASLAEGFVKSIKAWSRDTADIAGFENCIESLAYLSIRGSVKQIIANDSALLQKLFSTLKSNDSKAVHYGIVTIFTNVTGLRRRLTEEEEQLVKLREVSGESVTKLDPLDDDTRVEARVTKLVVAGVVTPLCGICVSATSSLAAAISQLFLNLCTDKRHRGRIVQDGGVKALATILQKLTDNSTPTSPSLAYLTAAQAIAKIAITTDPAIAFKPASRALDIVRPLIFLLSASDSTLQQFEGLMALTNLASYDDDVRTRIVTAKGVKAMEFLQFSENVMVRRAATEALCNMMCEPSVFNDYVSPAGSTTPISNNSNGGAGQGLRMMIMLCDVDDYETRRAASGALAILSASPDACRLIVADSRGLDTIVGLLFGEEENANPELLHRGVEICKNIAAVGGSISQRLEGAGIVKLLRGLVLNPVQEISYGAVEALRNLQNAGVSVLSKKTGGLTITEIID
ncbi:hypothetical protein HK100_007095 [Physocladia obscura]|uniref:UNC-45/Cro1/She4 central domain-containing protein n=1 Tax=Physocladia obscura TaxID=109957 RepID=A0AAD5SS03_9FUNG|nr:hypothetical protein HK100_007095 [Physocladia obscura]